MLQDVRYAVRGLRSRPSFALIALVTLALGIGVNTAVFSVLNAVVLTPLGYEEPERLVRVHHTSPGDDNGYLTGLAAIAYRDRSQTLDIGILYTYSVSGADMTDGAEPERVTILPVGADYFRVLGARPLLGEPFGRADERRNANVAVIRERLWRKYLDGRSDAAGQLLTLDDRPTAIFAANDLSAIQTMRTAHELRIDVPYDLSVIGFDNVPESALTHPPLTTVDQSIQSLGYEAVLTLIELIERPERRGEAPRHVALPTRLVVRRSTTAPRESS